MAKALHPELSAARRQQWIGRGVALFDGGRYFAAHECWEVVWRSTEPEPRDLWQGLVQIAAAFHHLRERGRPDVARRLLAKARRRLARLPAVSAGIDVGDVLAQADRWLTWLEQPAADQSAGEEPPPPRLGQRPPA